ncbi:hypothetical protein RAH32_12360 [Paracoccus sp. WLY502]|uniref:hypothetical protein n=1 Tax=Paracoccus yibinensis TaxID=3068891 RepID=UPI0027969A2D|nr:hypothetical protein [Paracoccus sp. WLY502]MDQ1901233.1 hypothetical protein [Paracoccus sp. WLY502]
MRKAIAAALWLGLSALTTGHALAGEAGDAVFAERGPWSLDGQELQWSVHVEGPDAPGFLRVNDGSVILAEAIDPSDQQPVLQLTQKTDTRTRQIGPFPISGGDPVLTFFLEQTARDMAGLTGGSPHYIRNRIKDALFRGGQITRQGEASVATFTPFAEDPNAARMGGFQTLTLTFVLGDPKQPIRELRAETQGAQPGYLNRMALQ